MAAEILDAVRGLHHGQLDLDRAAPVFFHFKLIVQTGVQTVLNDGGELFGQLVLFFERGRGLLRGLEREIGDRRILFHLLAHLLKLEFRGFQVSPRRVDIRALLKTEHHRLRIHRENGGHGESDAVRIPRSPGQHDAGNVKISQPLQVGLGFSKIVFRGFCPRAVFDRQANRMIKRELGRAGEGQRCGYRTQLKCKGPMTNS